MYSEKLDLKYINLNRYEVIQNELNKQITTLKKVDGSSRSINENRIELSKRITDKGGKDSIEVEYQRKSTRQIIDQTNIVESMRSIKDKQLETIN